MKDKWKALFAFLGISNIETSADGVFMKEEDVDKFSKMESDFNSLKSENESLKNENSDLKSSIEAKEQELNQKNQTTINEKDAEISALTASVGDLKTALDKKENELAIALGKETKAGDKNDPSLISAKKKLSKNELAAAKNAAALFGNEFSEDEE